MVHSNPAMPEPMNASSHHPKIKLSITPAEALFVAGTHLTGKLEMECRAEGEKGLGIGIVMIELFAIQELTSRDHLATNTFLHTRRLFQGPGLPPSNAVLPHPLPPSEQTPALPEHYHPARRGRSTFFFQIPLPGTCPSTISFAKAQAKVRYELRASAGVCWKTDRRLVVCRRTVEVVERFALEEAVVLDVLGGVGVKVPEGVVIGEAERVWVRGRVVGGVVVAGASACVELQVKNHSLKKNTSLTLFLTRTLYLPLPPDSTSPPPVQISDTLVTVPFRGPEYIVQPGTEGVANLVFDVPKEARGVRGGTLDGEELEEGGQLRVSESLFEIRCRVEVKLGMGMGSKDIRLEIPIDIVHPKALPEDPNPFVDQVWIPPPVTTPYSYAITPPIIPQPTGLGLINVPYMLPIHSPPPFPYPNHNQNLGRPLSAGPIASASQHPQSMVLGFPAPDVSPIGLIPFPAPASPPKDSFVPYDSPPPHKEPSPANYEPEEGKGERAVREWRHLLPLPPTVETLQPTTTTAVAVLHSPRPQLTPKHSMTNITDAYTRATRVTTKSERVEVLEEMADVVVRRSGEDLSGGGLRGVVKEVEQEQKEREREREKVEREKSLPVPPSVSDLVREEEWERRSKGLLPGAPPPLADLTPPTPTLHALVMRSRGREREKREVRDESGLDALERRLLREVGTRKMEGPARVDVRSVLGVGGEGGGGGASVPIPIPAPVKSPEEMMMMMNNDSAISSLTLAGQMMLEGMDDLEGDDDPDSDGGRTHRAISRSSAGGRGDEIRGVAGGNDDEWEMRHTRERASVFANGGAPAPALLPSIFGMKEKGAGRKKSKAKAKGCVAAWLGEIDIGVPPLEQVIPPSPSVVRGFDDLLEEEGPEEAVAGTIKPDPRSSGFVPIGSSVKLKTLGDAGGSEMRKVGVGVAARPVVVQAGVAEEARRVEALWAGFDGMGSLGYAPAKVEAEAGLGRAFLESSPLAKVVPDFPKREKTTTTTTTAPMSYSAVAKKAGERVVSPQKATNNIAGRIPALPPPPVKLKGPGDPGVKYDLRSARGGRGGRVTSVANLWASGAIASASAGGVKGKGKVAVGLESVDREKSMEVVRGVVERERQRREEEVAKAPLMEKKLFSAALMAPPPPPASFKAGPANTTKPLSIPAQKPSEPRKVFPKAPNRTTAATSKRPFSAPKPGGTQSLALSQGGRTTPMPGFRTPPGPGAANAKSKPATKPGGGGGGGGGMIIPLATTNPALAVVSSSHAVPHLSSTASLVRPKPVRGVGGSGKVGDGVAPVLSMVKEGDALEGEGGKVAGGVADLSFGQARLRDLIRKYQG